MENKNLEELLKGIKDIKPTSREAALLASLDEAENKKFKPEDIGAVPEELIEEEKPAEEPTKEEVVEEPANEKKEEVAEPAEEAKEEAVEEPIKEKEEPVKEDNHVVAINDCFHDGLRPQEEENSPVEENNGEDRSDKKEIIVNNEHEDIVTPKADDKDTWDIGSYEAEEKTAVEEKEVTVEEPVEEKKGIAEENQATDTSVEEDEDEEGLTEEEKEARRKLKIRGSISQAVGESETSKVPGKFEIFPEDDQFKYRLKANNGEILVVSYGYSTRDGAHAGIDTLKKNLEEGMVAYTTDKNGHSQWRLSTSNDSRIVALGETYSSLASAQSAFASTQKFGKATKIIDLDEIPDSEKREWHFTCEEAPEKDSGSIEIYDDSGKFRARLLANNQEVLFVTAQRYSSKASLKSALDNIKEKLNKDAFHVSKDKQGRYQFIMESGSGFVYLVGETYSTRSSCESAASSVLAFINKAAIHDLTLKSSDVDVTLTGVKKSEE